MAKTLIQILNDVAKPFGLGTGTEFTSLTQDAFAVKAVTFINEAKRMVEDSWKWDVLRGTITFTSTASLREYDTSSLTVVTSDPVVTTERSYVYEDKRGRIIFYDVTDTNEFPLNRRSRDYAVRQQRVGSNDVAKPGVVSIFPKGAGLTVLFPNAPSAARNYSFEVINPQADLAATGTTVIVDAHTVTLAAIALVAEDIGDELGVDSSTWWKQYEHALGAAMARDVRDEDTTLYADTLPYWNN